RRRHTRSKRDWSSTCALPIFKEDVKWLGADWKEHLYFASDYFEVMYECAVKLIKKGKAFVCDLTAEEMREYRGTLTEPGKNSPYRNRSVEENLKLFEEMRAGKYKDRSEERRVGKECRGQ